ncbi:MAG: toxin [Bacteroidota bacterium]
MKSIDPASREEITRFLEGFTQQKKKYGIRFYQRKKNMQALLDLEISVRQRDKVLSGLQIEDYYKGPREDGVNQGAEFWEFGVYWKKKDVYIKISIGLGEEAVRCFSFHAAERPIKYPYK